MFYVARLFVVSATIVGGAIAATPPPAGTLTFHGCWVAFAKTGKPVCPDAPPWPAFSVGSDIWMEVGEPVTPQPVSATPILNFLQSRLEK
jgi:hypothetical protein